MNTVDKDELFGTVKQYLKSKGIELEEGSYTRTIHKGCQVLADTINLSQQAVERAKSELQRNLDRARQTIHEKTAPKPSVTPDSAPPKAAPAAPPKIKPAASRKPAARQPAATRGQPRKPGRK